MLTIRQIISTNVIYSNTIFMKHHPFRKLKTYLRLQNQ